MTKRKPQKSELEPQVWIESARLRAEAEAVPYYVFSRGYAWDLTKGQPGVGLSHWRLDPDGSCWAHLAEKNLTEYRYERSDR